ncbi:MAG TPA: hypothetical protein VJ652_15270 [Noviherbaspirillum sp.]|nr:hypothetical protein [Noviherbaspirillum sp.]
MHIQTEKDITGEVAKQLRLQLGLSQKAFWTPLGITQTAGCRYETNERSKIFKPVRMLIFLHYVAGLTIDASTADGAAQIKRLGQLAAAADADDRAALGSKIKSAMEHMKQAAGLLSGLH